MLECNAQFVYSHNAILYVSVDEQAKHTFLTQRGSSVNILDGSFVRGKLSERAFLQMLRPNTLGKVSMLS